MLRRRFIGYSSVQFSSVILSCLTVSDPMKCSMRGLPVHHQLPASTDITWVGDDIQPSNSLSPLLFLPSIFPSIRGFSNESALCIRWRKYCSFIFNISLPRTELLQHGLLKSVCSPRDSQESSSTPQFKRFNYSVLSFLYSPNLTSIHDHWKNNSLD